MLLDNGWLGGTVTSPSTHDWVAIADGDDVGIFLDAFAVDNNLTGLLRASMSIDADRERLASWFKGHGATIVLSVADTVVATGSGTPPIQEHPVLAPTWSVGVGMDLSGAHVALAAAKATGKNRTVDGRDWQL